jgi:hypothetical protein
MSYIIIENEPFETTTAEQSAAASVALRLAGVERAPLHHGHHDDPDSYRDSVRFVGAATDAEIREALRVELDRRNPPGEPCAAIVVLPRHEDDDAEIVRVGDDWVQARVSGVRALRAVRDLPEGAPLGTADAEPGSVWAALNAAE